jgi:hypothetical protein
VKVMMNLMTNPRLTISSINDGINKRYRWDKVYWIRFLFRSFVFVA